MDKWDLIYTSTFGAYFANQVSEHIDREYDAPEDEDYERFAEEADTVAREAASRYDRRNNYGK